MRHAPRPLLIAVALAAALAAGTVHAQAKAPKARDEAATRAALDAARAELERSARKVAELSRQLGEHPEAVRMRRLDRRPVLGVVLAPDAQAGVRIAAVTPDSAAAKAGLRSGDRLIAIDGRQILGSSADLRVANARGLLHRLDAKTPAKLSLLRGTQSLVLKATPSLREDAPFVFIAPNGDMVRGSGDVLIRSDARRLSAHSLPPGVSPRIEREIVRIGPDGECKGKRCARLPLLAETFRWNGLNLAAVDPQLGRYFGTDRGVLVLSTGRALPGLQPGDVLRKVDGKPVDSPREAMAVLESRPAGSSVSVEYLRDRKTATARVTVPKAMPLRFPAPPPPPPAPAAPPAPPAPAAPPPPPQAFEGVPEAGAVVLVARAPAPPVPPLPPSSLAPAID